MNCPYCSKRILTEVENESTWIGYGISFVLFAILGIWAIPLMILLIPITQQINHSCPNCRNRVGGRSFYDLLSLQDSIISYQMGTLAILITRKQLIAVFIFLLFIIIFYVFFNTIKLSRGSNITLFILLDFIKEDWETFEKNCSKAKFIENNEKTLNECYAKYRFVDINWKGYVIRVDYDEHFFAQYRMSLLIKMQTDDLNEDGDLALKFLDHEYNIYKNTIFNLTRGDYIEFNATFISEGGKDSNPVLEGFGIENLHRHIKISPHIHSGGRYSTHDETIKGGDSIYKEIPDLVSDEEVKLIQHETSHR
jgi:hypothetical protein